MNARILPTLFCVMLLASCACAQAQDSSQVRRAENISLLAIQVELGFFMPDPQEGPLVTSYSFSQDLDFSVTREAASRQSRLGLQFGITRFEWPDMDAKPKDRLREGYSGVDYDLLGRYTYLMSLFRYDVLAGLTVRDGSYYGNHFDDDLTVPYTSQTSVGFKLGGAVTFMLLRPVIGLRLKGSMFFFGYKPIEAGAIGLGLVVGWQQRPEWD